MKVKFETMVKIVIPYITKLYGFKKEKNILKPINVDFLIFSRISRFVLEYFAPVF